MQQIDSIGTHILSLCLSLSFDMYSLLVFSPHHHRLCVCVVLFFHVFNFDRDCVFFHFIWIAEHLYESFVCCFILLRFMCIFSIQKRSSNASKLYSNRKLTSQCKREKSTNVLQKQQQQQRATTTHQTAK